jgi:hypothetical protein
LPGESPVFDAQFRADRVLTVDGTPLPLPGTGERFAAGTYAGRGRIDSALVNDSGFGQVRLSSSNTVEFAQSTTLVTPVSLTVDAPVVNVAPNSQVRLESAHTVLGATPIGAAPTINGAVSGGSGALHMVGRNVDLVGDVTLQGVGQMSVTAQQDLRLRGVSAGGSTDGRSAGSLTTAGDVSLRAGQIYPTTQTDFTLRVVDRPQGRIDIAGNGAFVFEPLSAAGSVRLQAPHVASTGRIVAPHGRIEIDAPGSLTLGAGAVLSVAGSLDVLYGAVFNGSIWNFGYHLQAAHYSDGFAAASGLPVLGMVFVCVEADYPHAAAAYVLDDEAMQAARAEIRRLMSIYAECKRSGQWPGYPSAIASISLPKWAQV